MSTSQTAEQAQAPDCPHEHFKDISIENLRSVVRRETDGGEKIVRFLVKAMEGGFPSYGPDHELEAAKILANLGSDEAAEFVRSYGQQRRRKASPKGERTSTKKLASDYGQSDPNLVIDPVVSDIARFIRDETSDGKTIVRRLIQIMEAQDDPYKPHHNLSAARELLNRGWAFPNAIECSWFCTHHVSAQYFNGHKNGHNGAVPTLDAIEGDDNHTNQKNHANHSSDESDDHTNQSSDTPEPKKSFTDIDSLPEPFWMRVLDLCERLEEVGRIPPLPLGPDDPLPDLDRIKVIDFPEVDLTDDDVASRFWKRVGEQIEIQEDWSELSRYRPERPEPSIWQLVLERMRSQAQQDPESQEIPNPSKTPSPSRPSPIKTPSPSSPLTPDAGIHARRKAHPNNQIHVATP